MQQQRWRRCRRGGSDGHDHEHGGEAPAPVPRPTRPQRRACASRQPVGRPVGDGVAGRPRGPGLRRGGVPHRGRRRARTRRSASGDATASGRRRPARTAAYTTRVLVRRPSVPAKFNGTVVVEWFNVTGGIDAAPDFGYGHVELLRGGYIWVGVSAQASGRRRHHQAGPHALRRPQPSRRRVRLRHLHPGRARAVRAGQLFDRDYGIKARPRGRRVAVRDLHDDLRERRRPLGQGLRRLLVHSRFGGAGGLADGAAGPNPAEIRDDTEVPVLVVLSETDVGFNLADPPARRRALPALGDRGHRARRPVPAQRVRAAEAGRAAVQPVGVHQAAQLREPALGAEGRALPPEPLGTRRTATAARATR